MKSLFFKLTVAFLVVGLVGSIVVLLLFRLQNERALDRFVLDLYQSKFVTELIGYYQTHGSWEGAMPCSAMTPVENSITLFTG